MWVSTVMPGMPNALPSTTLAVLRPTPGSVTRSLRRARHLAAEPLAHRLGHADDRGGLRAEEPGRHDDRFHLGAIGARVVGGGRVLGEQHRGDHVHPLVGALGGQDRRDQQLERVGEVELDVRVGIQLVSSRLIVRARRTSASGDSSSIFRRATTSSLITCRRPSHSPGRVTCSGHPGDPDPQGLKARAGPADAPSVAIRTP